MSVYYDLYASGNPQKKDEQQPLHARVIPSGTLDAKKFIELVSKSNGFSQATIEGCLQAVTDELQHWLKQGWIVEVGELGYFSLSLKCDHPVMEKKEIRSPSIHLNKVNLRINKKFRESLEPLPLHHLCRFHETSRHKPIQGNYTVKYLFRRGNYTKIWWR